MRDSFVKWLRPATYLRGSFLTLFGAALTTSAALTMVAAWILESTGREVHPYAGILLFLILPALFVLGLLLMPIGVLVQRRKARASGAAPLRIDLRSPEVLRALTLVGL